MTGRRISALLLDLDGVVYLGPRLLPGVSSTIRTLAACGVRSLYVTNNATRTRSAFAAHLRRLGLPCRNDDVMNTARAAALLLRARYGRGGRIVVVGERGLPRELSAAGLKPVTAATRAQWERSRSRKGRADAVVVSFDRTLTYWKLCAALDALRGGAALVACNLDPTWPDHRGILPGTGSLVRLLEYASGRKAELVGKPDPAMFRMLLSSHGIKPSRALVVGDRLDVDITAGRRAGAHTALVLTGMSTRRDLARSRTKPDFVARSFSNLLEFVRPAKPPRGASRRSKR